MIPSPSPDFGFTEIQPALAVAVHAGVPPPALLIMTVWLEAGQ
jgi:hypothetical protein